MMRRSIPVFLSAISLFVTTEAFASISLSATRVIFDGSRKEANITVRNGGQNVLVQSWIDSDLAENTSLPFAITPPLARVAANQQQLLRILYEGGGMPIDKESVVWLNVQEIPQASASDANILQLAVRQRVKVFFRPADLPGEAAKAPAQLKWKLQNEGGQTLLKVNNPGHYHVSLADLEVGKSDKAELIIGATMIAPGEDRTFKLKAAPLSLSPPLRFASINDYGALQKFETTVNFQSMSSATPAEVQEQQ
ncbi:pilus assembly protein [Pseudomonas fragi]|uniref:fimbrial biogenesis chaperone n=1 Tax=Pseudomonas fragi TaxID=296 RepID=UPI000BA1C59B|nr:molecular chaperone [Pseudomonas fragi]PAA17703.1 pilus assembly protein [Pseudomonas fragi]PAA43911.1 pilus assembly protein [Pseudomonas fragi]